MNEAADRELVTQFQEALDEVPEEAAVAYTRHAQSMVEEVNRQLAARLDIAHLLGSNPIEVMFDNHHGHAQFMGSVLSMRGAPVLVSVVIWVYRSYVQRGFSSDYWPIQLAAWQEALSRHLRPVHAAAIGRVYRLLAANHKHFVALAQKIEPFRPASPVLEDAFNAYVKALIKPSMGEAVRLCQERIRTPEDIPVWWEGVILPAMHHVGLLWAEGRITVGQEHLATAITQRVLALFYPLILDIPHSKGVAIMTASPGELHEIGPRMVADILEIHGWDVHYAGANTPTSSIVDLVRRHNAQVLCISTTMPYNLPQVRAVIQAARTAQAASPLHILVGGQAYAFDDRIWRQIGADATAPSAEAAVAHLDRFLTGDRANCEDPSQDCQDLA